jgi:NAD-dependent DNA ligase
MQQVPPLGRSNALINSVCMTDALTSIRSVNNTDVITLGTRFGSLAAIMAAPPEQLATCPGIGPTKVKRIQEAFRAPFRRKTQPLRQPRIDEQLPGGGAEAIHPPAPVVVDPVAEEGHEEEEEEAEEVDVDEEGGSDEEAGAPRTAARAGLTDFLGPDSDDEELPSVLD